jgi:hypothetical protein
MASGPKRCAARWQSLATQRMRQTTREALDANEAMLAVAAAYPRRR